jgi:O-acetyl-ADP-ribose deacetylase (regulator of RNase III)
MTQNRIVHLTTRFPQDVTFEIVQGDITREMVDAIVNAANSQLAHGGGLARAIVERGGEIIQEESDAWVREHGPVTHAEPAVTSGGALACRYVIHAVGPVWGSGDEDAKLRQAVWGSLWRADQLGIASLALPAISTGIFGFPKERAARIIYQTLSAYFNTAKTGLGYVALVLYQESDVVQFLNVWYRGK